jgi:sulfur-oxidizing protein SoxA
MKINMFQRMIAGLMMSASLIAPTYAQDDLDNPAWFMVDDGMALWETPNGPNDVSLEECDLGLGAGVVEGAFAQLPRYFEDTNQVMDIEARILHCMETIQGRDLVDVLAKPYSNAGGPGTEMEALVAYVASESNGMELATPQDHPAEQAAYELGEQLFYFRAGPHDFSCATCHSQSNKRIRLTELANLTNDESGPVFGSWPAYRKTEGVVRTMGWRLQSCSRQQRLTQLQIGSEATTALEVFLAVNGAGAEITAPGYKR